MNPAPIRAWLAGALTDDVGRALDRLARTREVLHIAVMPDVHLAEDVCVGVAVAARRRLFPQAVGNDIGCGMAAIRFAGPAEVLSKGPGAARLLKELARRVPPIRHRQSRLPPSLLEASLSSPALERLKEREGRVEFATLGRGNHFLEFQADDPGQLWLMLHSGSRAMGPAILRHHLARASSDPSGILFLDAESPEARSYLADLEWALRYADASREAMVAEACGIIDELFGLTAERDQFLRCLHNHVRLETWNGESAWIHRKGAISAREGEPGIIPGSMGSSSYHVEGRACEPALYSSSHGSGRRMSRTEARARIARRDLEDQMRGVWFDTRMAERLRDEAPAAYKDIDAVMRAQKELTRVVRKLRPVLSYKGA